MNTNKQNILITGATGFIGKSFVKSIAHPDRNLYLLNRGGDFTEFSSLPNIYTVGCVSIDSFNGEGLPQNLDVIVHLAGLAHVNNEHAAIGEHLRINVGGAVAIKNIAKNTGVSHVIFMSSIKVHGESTQTNQGHVITEFDIPAPADPYAKSKYESEKILASLIEQGIRVSIIRPPLIYGPDVKANMKALFKFVRVSPINPFNNVKDKRSLLGIENLNDFLVTLVTTPPVKAYKKSTFIIADKKPVTLTELCLCIAQAMDKRIWSIRVPDFLLKMTFTVVGKTEKFQKLTQGYEAKPYNAVEYYNWTPPYGLKEGLAKLFNEKYQ